jgi:hypothetical protein
MKKNSLRPNHTFGVLETGALVVAGLLLIVLCVAFLPVVGILVAIPVLVMSLSFLLPKEQPNLTEKAFEVEESSPEGPVTLFDLPVSAKGPRFSVEGPRIDSVVLSAFAGTIPAEAGK